ncbi:hypothetical protein TNCV_875161 [Trichonephila clavipes]|nr:hypothetical protein TNCV_875161 [Trichonephila clavipes]
MDQCFLCCYSLVHNRENVWTLDCEHEFHIYCLRAHYPRKCPFCQVPLSREDVKMLRMRSIRRRERAWYETDSGYESG